MNTERRTHLRVRVQIPIRLSVLIPEDTFSTCQSPGILLDLSERGAMVQLPHDEAVYRSLLERTRFCRVAFLGHPSLPARATGKAVWLQPEGSAENRILKIGLFFEDCPAETLVTLRQFVEMAHLEEKQGSGVDADLD